MAKINMTGKIEKSDDTSIPKVRAHTQEAIEQLVSNIALHELVRIGADQNISVIDTNISSIDIDFDTSTITIHLTHSSGIAEHASKFTFNHIIT